MMRKLALKLIHFVNHFSLRASTTSIFKLRTIVTYRQSVFVCGTERAKLIWSSYNFDPTKLLCVSDIQDSIFDEQTRKRLL